ncbi:hypothetical protein O9929_26990 [Vibrio lentus]|nr:hypothetical protein [Vibrio lentus]
MTGNVNGCLVLVVFVTLFTFRYPFQSALQSQTCGVNAGNEEKEKIWLLKSFKRSISFLFINDRERDITE